MLINTLLLYCQVTKIPPLLGDAIVEASHKGEYVHLFLTRTKKEQLEYRLIVATILKLPDGRKKDFKGVLTVKKTFPGPSPVRFSWRN
jgi:hypothetical protein